MSLDVVLGHCDRLAFRTFAISMIILLYVHVHF